MALNQFWQESCFANVTLLKRSIGAAVAARWQKPCQTKNRNGPILATLTDIVFQNEWIGEIPAIYFHFRFIFIRMLQKRFLFKVKNVIGAENQKSANSWWQRREKNLNLVSARARLGSCLASVWGRIGVDKLLLNGPDLPYEVSNETLGLVGQEQLYCRPKVLLSPDDMSRARTLQ